jgi:hypothetical protein
MSKFIEGMSSCSCCCFSIRISGDHIMANEERIDTVQSIATAVQSMVDLGTIQVNVVVKSVETLTPLVGSVAKTMTDVIVSSANVLGSTVGAAAGLVSTAAGAFLNAIGAIAGVPIRFIGNVTGNIVSTAQSAVGTVANAAGSMMPARKI